MIALKTTGNENTFLTEIFYVTTYLGYLQSAAKHFGKN